MMADNSMAFQVPFNNVLYIGDEAKTCLEIIGKFNARLLEIEKRYEGWFSTRRGRFGILMPVIPWGNSTKNLFNFNFSKKNKIILVTYVFNTYLWFMMLFKKDVVKEMVPTKTELGVLKVLWQYGPSTVRFVHDKLNEQKNIVQYTSTLKLMQVMKEKEMLNRDETNMKHIYGASVAEDKVKGNLLGRFVDSMYNGSASSLMLALLDSDKTSAAELEKIKELLNKMDTNK